MKNSKLEILKIISYVFLGFVLIITWLPLLVIALTSFSPDKFGLTMPSFTFEWYKAMWSNRSLMNAITYTLQITFASTAISIVFGVISALGINGLSRQLKRKIIMLNNVPILNPNIVTATFLLIVFQLVGIIMSRNVLGFTTTLIAHVLFSTPYVVLSVLPKLSEINDGIYEASLDLGCTPNRALLKTILPNIKGGVLTGGLLAFTMSIDDFIITYFTTGKRQNFSTWLYGSLKTLRNGLWNQACAYNTLLVFITVIAVFAYQIINIKRKERKA